MFSFVDRFSLALLPQLSLADMFRHRRAIHQNHLDLQDLPESLQRDLGLDDGRGRRGEPDWGNPDWRLPEKGVRNSRIGEEAFAAARLAASLRSL